MVLWAAHEQVLGHLRVPWHGSGGTGMDEQEQGRSAGEGTGTGGGERRVQHRVKQWAPPALQHVSARVWVWGGIGSWK